MIRRALGRLLLCTTTLGAVAASARALAYLPAPYGGAVVAPLPDQPVTLDPAAATRLSELQVVSLIYDPIYRRAGDGPARPHLVEPEPEISGDGKTWRLRLRPGLMVTSGRPLTAGDVVSSLRRLKRGPNAHLLSAFRALESDGDVVVLHLARPSVDVPALLSAPATGVAVPLRGQLVGTGPFRLQSRSPSSIRLRANPSHFAGRPFLDEVQFTVFDRASAEVATFQVGGLQVSFHGSSAFGGRPRYPSLEQESEMTSLVFLGVGRGKSYLSDPQFRLALLRGIDRRRIGRLAGIGRNEVADSPVARLARSAPTRVAFDRGAANRLLARVADQHEAMRQDAAGGRVRLSLLTDASRFDDGVVAGQLIADLDGLGIAAAIESRPAAEYQARLEQGKYELVLGRQPLSASPAVDLASALAIAGDRAAAQSCLASAGCGPKEAAQFMRRLPLIPLVHSSVRVYRDARLGGARVSALGLLSYADIFWNRRVP